MLLKWQTFDVIFMNEHFLTYGAGSAAVYGIIGALTIVIYKSYARAHRWMIYS